MYKFYLWKLYDFIFASEYALASSFYQYYILSSESYNFNQPISVVMLGVGSCLIRWELFKCQEQQHVSEQSLKCYQSTEAACQRAQL